MAARTGASVGVAVTITIMGVFCLGLFVLTMVFYGNAQKAQSDLRQVQEDSSALVTSGERNSAVVQSVLDRARRTNETAISFLIRSQREMMVAADGNVDTTPEEFLTKVGAVSGSDANSLLGIIAALNGRIDNLEDQLTQADRDRLIAQNRAEQEVARVADIESDFQATADGLQSDVDDLSTQFENYSASIDETERRMDGEIDQVRTAAAAQQRALNTRVASLTQQNLILNDQLARARGMGADRVAPLAEEALVDGFIDQVNTVDNEVVLSIGRNEKVILGMTFAIYSDSTDIRPDATGAYRSGKATVEVIRVEQGFSRARIIESSEGDPISRGDVVANAVYDPNKTYTFVIAGNFDYNRDGIASAYEREDVEAMIKRWGGEMVAEITGDLDFMILGQRPTMPPAPGPGAPIEQVNEFVRIQRMIQNYDTLFDAAVATSIPLLNENRLRTLIGDYPQ